MNRSPSVWTGLRHIAHRCGGRLAPENTIDGLIVAAARGFRAVEFDVMLSAERTPVLIHDDMLDRTTSGVGAVAATDDATLFALQANRGFETAFPDARIPPLREVLRRGASLGLAMNVEIKPSPENDVATAAAVAATVAELLAAAPGSAPLLLLSSFSEIALREARKLLPGLDFALLYGDVPVGWRALAASVDATALHVSARQRDWSWLEPARAAGLAVRCYTVNDRAQAAALFERGVDAVFTDALDLFSADASATIGNKR